MAKKRKMATEAQAGSQKRSDRSNDLCDNNDVHDNSSSNQQKIRVAIYLRVSSGQQAEREISVPDQRRQCRVFCAARNWEVVAEFSDTKTGRNNRRPGLSCLREAALRSDRPFDIILVHSFSRLNRNEIENELLIRELRKNGVEVQSLTQNVGFDPVGDFCRRIIALFDEYQAAENAKHVTRARKENARQGFWNGSPPPFGYSLEASEIRGDKIKNKLSINSAEAAIVEKIFSLYLEGDGRSGPLAVKRLTKWLNEHGFRTRRGGLWGVNQIHRILTDSVYIGEFVFGRDEPDPNDRIRVECPAIVTKDTFNLVAKTLKSRSPESTPPRTGTGGALLGGLVACPLCGGGMTMKAAKSGKYRYYQSQAQMSKGSAGCAGKRIPAGELEDIVIGGLEQRLLEHDRVREILAPLIERQTADEEEKATRLASHRQDLGREQGKLDRLYDAIERGVADLDDSMFRDRVEKAKDRIARLKAMVERASLELSPELRVTTDKIAAFTTFMREKLIAGDTHARRAYLRALVSEIHVREHAVVLRGSREKLEQAVMRGERVLDAVPSFVPSWRRDREHNPH